MRRSFTLLLSFLFLSLIPVFGQNTGSDQTCFSCSGSNTIFSGNLGIGTSTPLQKIHLMGNIVLENTSTSSGQLMFRRVNGLWEDAWNIYSGTTGLIFSHGEGSGGSSIKPGTLLFLGNNDNVGICTSSPSEKLHVKGSILSEDNLITKGDIILADDPYSEPYWRVYRSTEGLHVRYLYDTSAPGGNEPPEGKSDGEVEPIRDALYIKNNTFVGIGTSSPLTKLHVAGAITATGLTLNSTSISTGDIIKSGDGGLLSSSTLYESTSGNIGIGTKTPLASLHVNGSILSVGNVTAKTKFMLLADATSNIGWHILRENDGLYFIHEAGGSTDVTKYNLYINNNGNVGIGTTQPAKKLEVSGDIKGTNLTLSGLSSDAGKIVKIGESGLLSPSNIYETSIGRVGIGTTQPHEQFQIGDIWTFHDGGTKYIGRNIKYTNSSGNIRIEDGYSSLISFGASGAINMIVYGTGNANNTAATQKGNLTLTSEGNVGIGTSNPTTKLSVNGVIRGKEVLIEATGWPDYVFTEDYRLMSIEEVSGYIEEYGHLPSVPSAAQVEQEGIHVGEMNTILLRKIEELTLYIIKMQAQIDELMNKTE